MILFQIAIVKILEFIERGLSVADSEEDEPCRECGGLSFLIANFSDPELEGTVRIDSNGNVREVEGLLFCAECGELFDALLEEDPELVPDQRHLRLVSGN